MGSEPQRRTPCSGIHQVTVSHFNGAGVWCRQQCSPVSKVQGEKQGLHPVAYREHKLLVGQVDLPCAHGVARDGAGAMAISA